MIGTRPEAIKLEPVARALSARGLGVSLVFTGQQAIAPGQFGLGGLRMIRLDCPGAADPHRHVGMVADALRPHLARPPDLLVVQGDTSSASGACSAAFGAGVAIAHVEAGLRTHDPQSPWPEEEYRVSIDAQSDLLFAPTERAARNLRDEAVGGEIHVTGNSGIDALLNVAARLPAATLRDSGLPRLLVTCHRRESWGEGLQAIAGALAVLAREGNAVIDMVLHPNAHVADCMRRLLQGIPNVTLLPPCSHGELVARMRDADLILSDSGGIQEEAPALGVPLLVLRDKTERPEGIACGNARLVGTDGARIVEEARALLGCPIARAAMSRRSFPYGDGRAGERIAAIVEAWLLRQSGAAVSSGRW